MFRTVVSIVLRRLDGLLWNARLPQQQRTWVSEAVRVCVRCDYRIVEWKRMQTNIGVCTRDYECE